ncbi:Acetyltransferase (GNAT) domain-containing protein [Jatrophihabitans endophyticus]|uniref:Acetyltransferase (GNAT) domain-containing protein n=1 Tax=Jatrophihabitans endophyticus TaxID=1206085 RepID=A0A1M5STA0_9ACTN|nr:GNAT family N-acetyltransferase [Jatrophihabitans endophyticus]SHH41769.1 Acetyltransferase (GNAT) domain-containing protein [Jatrophihabitans endophyticus]
MTVGIREVDAAVTRPLRLDVLRPGHTPDTVPPGDVAGAVHLAAYDDDELVGAVAVHEHAFAPRPAEPAMQFSGMAVAEDRRGSGVGAALLAAVVATAERHGAQVVWCNARSYARGFYERGGFAAIGDEFIIAAAGNLPHFVMWRRIGNQTAVPPRPPG